MSKDGLGNGFENLQDTLVRLEVLLDVRAEACIHDNVYRLLAPAGAGHLDPTNPVIKCDSKA